jgi:hypothetical protein
MSVVWLCHQMNICFVCTVFKDCCFIGLFSFTTRLFFFSTYLYIENNLDRYENKPFQETVPLENVFFYKTSFLPTKILYKTIVPQAVIFIFIHTSVFKSSSTRTHTQHSKELLRYELLFIFTTSSAPYHLNRFHSKQTIQKICRNTQCTYWLSLARRVPNELALTR